MQWESWAAFWNMGGRGFYVWMSYGVFFALIAFEILMLVRSRKVTIRDLRNWRLAMGKDRKTTGNVREEEK